MRRKTLTSVMSIVFVIFTFLGFRTANLTSNLTLPTQAVASNIQNSRVVLVQVDSLDNDQPSLKSVWVGVFFRSKNQAVISFVPVYPAAAGQPAAQALARSFKLDKAGNLSSAFLRRLKSLHIEHDGYIIVDDYALQEMAGWINRQGSLFYELPSQSGTPGEWFLELGCGSIDKAGANIANFAWDTISAHFRTNLPAEKLSAEWDGLFTSDQPLKCELVCE